MTEEASDDAARSRSQCRPASATRWCRPSRCGAVRCAESFRSGARHPLFGGPQIPSLSHVPSFRDTKMRTLWDDQWLGEPGPGAPQPERGAVLQRNAQPTLNACALYE
jgi:hypothetical protein